MSGSPFDIYAEVNFLPGWYLAQRKRRSALIRTGCIAMALVAGLGLATVQTHRAASALGRERDSIVKQANAAEKRAAEAAQLSQTRGQLQRQLAIHRQLHQPIDYSRITGTLAGLLPRAVALRSLDLQTVKVAAAKPAVAEKRTKKAAVKAVEPAPANVVLLSLEGVAPSDVDVANFIGKLASSGVFQNVKMSYSRQGREGNLIVREFSISMEIPLDCDYEPADGPPSQEVAHGL